MKESQKKPHTWHDTWYVMFCSGKQAGSFAFIKI